MTRFAFVITAGVVALICGTVIIPRGPHRSDESPARTAVEAPASPSPTEAPAAPVEAAVRPVEPSEGGGVPTGLMAGVGLGAAVTLLAVGLLRRRRVDDPPIAEVETQEDWYAVLYDGAREIRAGLFRWAAPGVWMVQAEVIRRAEAIQPAAVGYRCLVVAASRWVIYAGQRPIAEGAVAVIDGATAESRAVELLAEYAEAGNLAWDELRGLRCVVYGPDGLGEADGRDW